MTDSLALRRLSVADSAELAQLEARATPLPWSAGQYHDSLSGDHFGWGWHDSQQWVGLVLFSQVLDEASLLNIAIDPSRQRHGLARQLLCHAFEELHTRAVQKVFLEVRAGNIPAIRLYRELGFTVTGVRRGYYPALPGSQSSVVETGGREDALLMTCRLAPLLTS